MLLITAEMTFYELRKLKFLSMVTIRVMAFINTTSTQVCLNLCFKPGSRPAKAQALLKVVLQLKPQLQLTFN